MKGYQIFILYFVSILRFTLPDSQNAANTESLTRFLVSVRDQSHHFCTGAIISESLVLLAAHCLYTSDKNDIRKKFHLKVVAGLDDKFEETPAVQYCRVSEMIIHEDFDQNKSTNDIAMLILRDTIQEDGITKKHIALPKTAAIPGPGYNFVGWGSFNRPMATRFRDLYQKDYFNEAIAVLEKCWCKSIFGDILSEYMICAKLREGGFRGPCTDTDSGPIIHQGTLVGFVIFGFGCGLKNFPAVFNDIVSHKKWIQDMQNEVDFREDSDIDYVPGRYFVKDHPLAKHIVSIEHTLTPFIRYKFLCEGTILSSYIILTTASCLTDRETQTSFPASELWVLAGTSNRYRSSDNLEMVGVKEIRLHKEFTQDDILNDLALLLLKKDIVEDDTYKQRISISQTIPLPGQDCTYVIWNKTAMNDEAPEKLVFGEVLISNKTHCGPSHENLFCAIDPADFFRKNCVHHNGAPVICENKLSGVVAVDYGCGVPRDISWYTNIHNYENWIKTNLGVTWNNPPLHIFFLILLTRIF